MSVASLECPKCHQECRFDGLYPLPPGQQSAYGVAWKCPACGHRALDMCNLGPLVPTASSCLNCGADFQPGEENCPGCGLSREGVRSFLRLPETTGPDAFQAAGAALRRGWFRHGVALINQALLSDFQATDAWDGKVRLLEVLGYREAAETMLARALAAGAPSVLLVRYGSLLARRGAFAESVAAFQKFLDGSPDDPLTVAVVCSEQGRAFAELGDMPAAERAHEKAIAAAPTNPLLYLNYADTFIKQRRGEDALRVLDAGLPWAQSPVEKVPLLEARGHVLAGMLRGQEALDCVDQAVTLGSNSVKTHYIRGRALAMLGRLPEAKQAMEQVLRLDPNMAAAREALQQIDAALRG